MSLGDWFRRLLPARGDSAEEAATLHEEYGAAAPAEQPELGIAPDLGDAPGGVPNLAGLETRKAERAELEELEPPQDPGSLI